MTKKSTTKALQTATTTLTTVSKRMRSRLPARLADARKSLVRAGSIGVRRLKKHPVGALVGAFAIGVARDEARRSAADPPSSGAHR